MSVWRLRPQGLRLLGWAEVPLDGGLHPLAPVAQVQAGKAEPRSTEAKDSQFPRSLGQYPYLHQTEMLLFGKASVTSLQWGLWDNTLG